MLARGCFCLNVHMTVLLKLDFAKITGLEDWTKLSLLLPLLIGKQPTKKGRGLMSGNDVCALVSQTQVIHPCDLLIFQR